jgi:hypothetical protein
VNKFDQSPVIAADRRGSSAVSRRQLLLMAGALPAIPMLSRSARAEAPGVGVDGIVIRNGWILRADDLRRLQTT